MESVKLSVDAIHALARRCLLANGCNDENATALADTITAAERDGSASHGLFRLPGYVASLRSGKVDGQRQSPSGAIGTGSGAGRRGRRLRPPCAASRPVRAGRVCEVAGDRGAHPDQHSSLRRSVGRGRSADERGGSLPSPSPRTCPRWPRPGPRSRSSAPIRWRSDGRAETSHRWCLIRRRPRWPGER